MSETEASEEQLRRENIPLFHATRGALMFAFNHHPLVKTLRPPQEGDKEANKRRSEREWDGLDADSPQAGQAGMIWQEVTKLGPVKEALLVARFTTPTLPCACRAPCCRGFKRNAEWENAVRGLTEYALAAGLTGTISHYRLRYALVCRYFGDKRSFREVADQCGVDRDTASDYYKKISKAFHDEENAAFHEIDGTLKALGIVLI